MKDINKDNFKVLRQVVLPFIKKFKNTGLFKTKDFKEFKKNLDNREKYSYLDMGPFDMMLERLDCNEQPHIVFHKYYDDTDALKVRLPSFMFSFLAGDCNISIRDLFISHMPSISKTADVPLAFRDGLVYFGSNLKVLLMPDYDKYYDVKDNGYSLIVIIFEGEDLYYLEPVEIFKIDNDIDMRDTINKISSYL